jgi:hypothetical protein
MDESVKLFLLDVFKISISTQTQSTTPNKLTCSFWNVLTSFCNTMQISLSLTFLHKDSSFLMDVTFNLLGHEVHVIQFLPQREHCMCIQRLIRYAVYGYT